MNRTSLPSAEVVDILNRLPAHEAAILSAAIEPPWKQRERRLARRDLAIREALELLRGAENPAVRLAVQLAQQERETRPARLTGDHLLAEAAVGILQLNGGKGLTARQIANIAAGTRSPWKLSQVEISEADRA